MSIIKITLLAFAFSLTALFNLVSAQSDQVFFNTNSCGQETIEVTYTSDVPKYISFEVFGETKMGVGAYARVSNISNYDGTCTATYDVDSLMSCGAGEEFAKAYYTTKFIKVYDGKITPSAQLLFVVNDVNIIRKK
jgi:hypothetical protein